jgi:hypothetical protein
MATFPRLALISTGFPQFTTSTAAGYPSFSRVVASFPNVITFSPTPSPTVDENPVTMSPTPFNSPNPFTLEPTTSFPTELKIPESDYDYEEVSYYDIIRDKLESMRITWPLSRQDEHEITMHLKLKDPNVTVSTQLIKNAFLRGDADQKKALLEITDKIGYTL